MLLAESRKAAEQVIQEALRQLEEPTLISCAGSAGTLPGLWVLNPVGNKSHVTLNLGSQQFCTSELPGVLGPQCQDQFRSKLFGIGPGQQYCPKPQL